MLVNLIVSFYVASSHLKASRRAKFVPYEVCASDINLNNDWVLHQEILEYLEIQNSKAKAKLMFRALNDTTHPRRPRGR